MSGEVLGMSDGERERGYLVRQAVEHRLGHRKASERLGIGIRQFKRLVHAWKQEGDAGLVSRQRERASNNRIATDKCERITALLRDKYTDFGPTPAAEKLLELERIAVSRESIRQVQIVRGLWKPKTLGPAGVPVPRPSSAGRGSR
jgi:transposase